MGPSFNRQLLDGDWYNRRSHLLSEFLSYNSSSSHSLLKIPNRVRTFRPSYMKLIEFVSTILRRVCVCVCKREREGGDTCRWVVGCICEMLDFWFLFVKFIESRAALDIHLWICWYAINHHVCFWMASRQRSLHPRDKKKHASQHLIRYGQRHMLAFQWEYEGVTSTRIRNFTSCFRCFSCSQHN